MRWTNIGRWIGAAAALIAAFAQTASAQCIMCYMTANSTGEHGASVLRHGIMILMIPTLSVFAGLFLLAYLRRHAPDSGEESIESLDCAEDFSEPLSDPDLPVRSPQQDHLPSVS